MKAIFVKKHSLSLKKDLQRFHCTINVDEANRKRSQGNFFSDSDGLKKAVWSEGVFAEEKPTKTLTLSA